MTTLVEKKIHPSISKILQISFTQIFFFIFFDKGLFSLSVTQIDAVLSAANRFVGLEILNTTLLTLSTKILKF